MNDFQDLDAVVDKNSHDLSMINKSLVSFIPILQTD